MRSTAKWDGIALIIETTRDFQGMAIATKEIRRLDNSGKERIVETATETPQGVMKRKVVYTKS